MTAEITEKQAKYCIGCGVQLQDQDKSKPGFVPTNVLEQDEIICQRCFRIRNYNEVAGVAVDNDEFLHLLGSIASTKSLVVHIVDIHDFEGSLISGLQRFVGSNPVLLVVNKLDLLPKAINENRLRNWIQQRAKEEGLRTVDIVLCSAKRNRGFDRVVEAIGKYREDRDVFVVGATNVGKSTLINRLIHDYSDLERELTTSRYPGTTLDAIHIPLEDGKYIIDTPGIVYTSRLTEVVPRSFLGTLLPEKPLKPMVYQLNPGQTLFVGSIARFDFVSGPRQSFTFYLSNALRLHRTKLERADALYEEHRGELLGPPSVEELADIPEWTRHSMRVTKGTECDIFIAGLGWIKVNGKEGAELDIYAPRGIKVLQRKALI